MSRQIKRVPVEDVEKFLQSKGNAEIANLIDVHPSRVSQYKSEGGVPLKTIMNRLIKTHLKIEPIIELEIIPTNKDGQRDVRKLRKLIIDKLKVENGVYIFYDSLGKPIYAGKTKRLGNDHLFGEIKNAWDRPRDSQQKIRVKKSSSFVYKTYKLKDASYYISAYAISEEHISTIEAFITRIMPNNLTNKKIESI